MAKKTALAEKLEQIRERIAAACGQARRDVGEVTLIAVTKTAAPEQVREILQLGVGDLGESRVQVLQQRAGQIQEFISRQKVHGSTEGFPAKLRWHMIGHLQRNKVKPILPIVSLIHSVDSLRLAEEIDVQAAKLGKKIPVLMQINASEEPQKYGVAVGAAVHLAEQIDSMPNLQIMGLMTMAPLGTPLPANARDKDKAAAIKAQEVAVRRAFARTREIFEEMKWHKIGGAALRHLSMGMSDDFEPAILEGATLVRIGTLLFGGKVADEEMDE